MIRLLGISFVTWMMFFAGCQPDGSLERDTLFEMLPSEQTGVDFENHLEFLQEFNIYTYRNFYDGGGVAAGDVSGNGLPDLYFVSNMGDNRLYVNLGDYRFEDVTEQAGVAGTRKWSTGASMVDINGNGLLDIYVTNSGELDDRRNELFINNGDGTFTESAAEYGLDDPGYSIHATFFDYNGDGLVDVYIINNADEAITSFDLSNNLREERDYLGGDRLYRNDGGTFTDVTEEAGLYSSIIGFALSASVGDINRNGLPDLFVANDFFERDYLYMNNGDGTFTEVIDDQRMRSMSAASMGSDIADLNNNGWPDIYVLDMLPKEQERIKTVTIFEDWARYSDKVEWGYGHQFTRNVLHLNHGDTTFSEIGRFSGVEATDWSWAALLADFDHNGFNDIFVTNGLVQDITNLDYLQEVSDPETVREIVTQEVMNFDRLIDIIPSVPVRNFAFGNDGDLRFTDRTREWGLDEPGFSSGAAWADLNGNGSLDLVVNNVNGPSRIYKNRAVELYPVRTWLRVDLKGNEPNTQAVGAQLQVWADGKYWFREHILQRGFQSSMEPGLHVGTGEVSRVDSLVLRWPDGSTHRVKGLELPARITLDQTEAHNHPAPPASPPLIQGDLPKEADSTEFEEISEKFTNSWSHRKYDYVDFTRERMLTRMRSTEGPGICSGDISGNGLEDVYIGGARDQAGMLYLQQTDGNFIADEQFQQVFEADSRSEDVDCVMFDATGNGNIDLYVASGGNSFSSSSSALGDRLYFNRGDGTLERSNQILPSARRFESSSVVEAADFTGNGHQDLFVGVRLRPFAVGMPAGGYLLENDGNGKFRDATDDWAPELREAGMITDAAWTDWIGNGLPDLVVVGEWMPVRVFRHEGTRFEEITGDLGLAGKTGWWHSVTVADLNGNGRMDIAAGNHGLNSRFRASEDRPVRMWVGDFARNGLIEQIMAMNVDGRDYPVALRHHLIEEIPSLAEKFPDYESYGGKTVQEILTSEQLANARLLEAAELASVVIWNRGDSNRAMVEPLPDRAQFAPVLGLLAGNWSGNGTSELLLSGNLYEVKPQMGPYDALRGVHLQFNENEQVHSIPPTRNGGFEITGAGRRMTSLTDAGGNTLIAIARNNDKPILFRVHRVQ